MILGRKSLEHLQDENRFARAFRYSCDGGSAVVRCLMSFSFRITVCLGVSAERERLQVQPTICRMVLAIVESSE